MKINIIYTSMFRSCILLIIFMSFVGCMDRRKDTSEEKEKKPNIIIIYADDLGYGDLSSYGATEISTPSIDSLVNGGVKFTNGYATSATCTPSRFALLTGTYPWRNEDAKILPGTAPLLIDTAQVTIPKMLRKEGYKTGIVGKWHLGLGNGNVNWNDRIRPGPNEVGFDYSYIMAATQDRVPTVYIDNGRVANLDPDDPIEVNYKKNFEGEPTGKDNPELLKLKWHHGHNNSIVNGIPRIGFMKGGETAKWKDEEMAENFLNHAKDYVSENKNEPFFLYYALQQPHVPRTPSPQFEGKSGMGARGDVLLEADWCVGELMKTLREEGLLENTLIIFSSDNGPVLNDGYYDNAVEKLGDHTPWGDLRGGKYSLFEAGTKVPFAVYWEGKIKPKVSDALVSQMDILSSLKNLIEANTDLQKTDSKDILDSFMGKSNAGRDKLIVEASGRTALRMGDYIMIPPYKGPQVFDQVNIESGNSDDFQLYNIKNDPGQKDNLADAELDKLKKLYNEYQSIVGEYSKDVKPLELK
ncbi:MAG: arylsulfatase [Cytophagaceae bacterium]|nr:arylsulfatase [Cytophagaceae bacterium]